MPYHGLRADFFLVLSNIVLSVCTTVYLSIHLLKDILVASTFWQMNQAAINIHSQVFILFIYLFIYLFMAVLGLRFCARAFSSCGEWRPLFIVVRGPLTIEASLVAEHRLRMHRLSNCGSRA